MISLSALLMLITKEETLNMKYNIVQSPFNSTIFNDNAFSNLFDNFMTLNHVRDNYMTVPRANVIKNENGYSIELAAPGFSRDEFELSVDNNTLTVSVNTEDTPDYEKSVTMREYKFQSFTRSWTLPENSNVEGVTARYDAGILYVDVPVESQRRGKTTISVQ
tara:strand:- start:350 stop:838 length:489 start_codon:yes stop_codon:yes gene_type:complete